MQLVGAINGSPVRPPRSWVGSLSQIHRHRKIEAESITRFDGSIDWRSYSGDATQLFFFASTQAGRQNSSRSHSDPTIALHRAGRQPAACGERCAAHPVPA